MNNLSLLLPEILEVSLEGSLLTIASPEDWYGNESWEINVSDGDLNDINTIIVTVNPINDAPIILSSSPNQIDAADGYNYLLEVADVDDNEFIFELNYEPDGMYINEFGALTWIPSSTGLFGPIIIIVTDLDISNPQSVSQEFYLDVRLRNV